MACNKTAYMYGNRFSVQSLYKIRLRRYYNTVYRYEVSYLFMGDNKTANMYSNRHTVIQVYGMRQGKRYKDTCCSRTCMGVNMARNKTGYMYHKGFTV